MSSPEFAELHGISGTAAAKRCGLLMSPLKRQLLWFIQGISLQPGGLKRMVRELLEMFPTRCRRKDLALGTGARSFCWNDYERLHSKTLPLEEFLIDLCINPRRQIQLSGEDGEVAAMEADRVKDQFGDAFDGDFLGTELDYFDDLIGSLEEYKRRYEERAKAEFYLTAIGRQIWKELDASLKSKTMIVIDGLEGRGKTEAIQAWCNCHLGVARFITLDGTNTKTSHFTQFAKALGVGHSNSHKVSQMQANVKEVLLASRLMPVIDEAHFFFNQAPRVKTRPEMMDWIDTALCNRALCNPPNPPLPVALVTTPQFLICVERAASQVEWNYRQFRRRSRYVRLARKNTPEDIEAVARTLLPGADKPTIKQVIAYEALSKRDLSAVGDVAREAKLLAEEAGASSVTFEHVRRAIHEVLIVSDVPWAEMEKRLQQRQLGRKRGAVPLQGRFMGPAGQADEAGDAAAARPDFAGIKPAELTDRNRLSPSRIARELVPA
jgi:hypothetical protein